ncbi:hypothetical protein PR202_gb26765 [Eleusine coracana subsp. coracana]|uniref:Uncharacterized protein n=1 Tax=Eleusine coracana subsp. coracana TaxID=191504 RepID=A0AAV5FSM9_ELECO|nr:hypothetical protein PR202_gb26765 [Eleusine coracana subsp. coracana]
MSWPSVTPPSTVTRRVDASTDTTLLSASVLTMRPRSPPGQASFGTLWEKRVATFILVPDAVALATTARSSPSEDGNAARAAWHVDRSGNAPYALVTVQSAVPPDLEQWTTGGGAVAPAR